MQKTEIKKQWIINNEECDESVASTIIEKYRVSPVAASIITERAGNTLEAAEAYINRDILECRDPRLLNDIEPAVERILKAVESGKDTIAIYGDYDVDGVTSVSMMYLYLCSLGLRVGYYIPSRNDEGYGVNKSAIRKLHSKGVTLIITVDTGITAIEEIEYAKALGIDVIITDHHECRPELPDAVAVINPHREDCNYPFKELAGVGVAFKLICAVELARCSFTGKTEYEAQRSMLLTYGDLVAIGTVADVMPIVDENRTIVSLGLKIIQGRPRLGVAALMNAAASSSTKREINSTFIGFSIAPRLNAAGRMGNAASSVELLLAEDEETADMLANQLCETNKLRQSEENKIVDSALEKIEEDWNIHLKNGAVIVLADDEWQQGVIGIVASRITEKYGMPSILVTFEGMPTPGDPSVFDLGKGSGRSVKGFNLVNALSECSDLLEKYGGHELAAGLSVRRGKLDEFRERLNDYARPIMKDLERVQILEADRELKIEDMTLQLAQQISNLIEPCGPGNPTPAFVLSDVKINSIRSIGAGKHLKLTFEKGGRKLTGLYFGVAEPDICFKVGDLVDVMFNVSVNHYNGNTELQMILIDVRYACSVFENRVAERKKLFDILSGAPFSPLDNYLPSRQDFVFLYKFFEGFSDRDMYSISDSDFIRFMDELPGDQIKPSFIKYRIMLEVFKELDIITVDYIPLVSDKNGSRWALPEDICVIKRGGAKKVNLDDSSLLLRLRGQMIDY